MALEIKHVLYCQLSFDAVLYVEAAVDFSYLYCALQPVCYCPSVGGCLYCAISRGIFVLCSWGMFVLCHQMGDICTVQLGDVCTVPSVGGYLYCAISHQMGDIYTINIPHQTSNICTVPSPISWGKFGTVHGNLTNYLPFLTHCLVLNLGYHIFVLCNFFGLSQIYTVNSDFCRFFL